MTPTQSEPVRLAGLALSLSAMPDFDGVVFGLSFSSVALVGSDKELDVLFWLR